MSSELRAAAWGYLTLGLSVIALTGKMPNGKVHRHGLHDALAMDDSVPGMGMGPDDDAVLKAVFDHPDTTGVGILTNWPYFVVDIDGEEGAVNWQSIVGEDWIPDRWVAQTGRGLHLWFADSERRATTKLADKLDLKGNGGYVAAPPSIHPDGRKYIWLLPPGDLPPIEAPAGLIALLDDRAWAQEGRILTRAASKRVRHPQFQDGKWWATWGFEGLLRAVAEAEPGQRNAILYWAAYAMSEEDADIDDLEQLHRAAREAGLTEQETRRTINSARKAAASE
jgi:hypothetical protein